MQCNSMRGTPLEIIFRKQTWNNCYEILKLTQELIFKQTSHWIISINQLTNSTVFVDQKNPDTIHLLVSLQQLS